MPNISNYIFEEHIKIHILEYLSRLHSNSNFMFYDGYMNMTKAYIYVYIQAIAIWSVISIILYINCVDEGKPQR